MKYNTDNNIDDSIIDEESLVDKDKKKATGVGALIRVLTFFLITISCTVVIVKLYDWYCSLQERYFDTNSSLLFIHSSYSIVVIIAATFMLGLILFFWLFNKKHRSDPKIRVKYMISAIAVILIALVILTFSFFNYSVIKENGISIQNTPFEEKDYSWNDVEQASVEYQYRYKNGYKYSVSIKYILSMSDGNEINLLDSNEFFNKILTLEDLFEKKGVKIVRMKVNEDVYNDLKNDFSGPSRTGVNDRFQDVVVKLFNIT